jgi:hypothetical protein
VTVTPAVAVNRSVALDMDGKCKLTVIHDDFPTDSTVLRMVSTGWPAVISSLKTLLETGHHIDDPA